MRYIKQSLIDSIDAPSSGCGVYRDGENVSQDYSMIDSDYEEPHFNFVQLDLMRHLGSDVGPWGIRNHHGLFLAHSDGRLMTFLTRYDADKVASYVCREGVLDVRPAIVRAYMGTEPSLPAPRTFSDRWRAFWNNPYCALGALLLACFVLGVTLLSLSQG